MLSYLVRATLQDAFLSPLAPITWAALILGYMARLSAPQPFQPRELLVGLPLGFTVLLIAYGTVFELSGGETEAPWREPLIWIILAAQILTSGLIIWKLDGLRRATAGLLLFQFCVSFAAGLEACMSVTNRWL